jgi:hypothetical protein
MPGMTTHFIYTSDMPSLKEFSAWLDHFIQSENFRHVTRTYIRLKKELESEKDETKRKELIRRLGLIRGTMRFDFLLRWNNTIL